MVSLYCDPTGKKIFSDESNPTSTVEIIARSGIIGQQVTDTESEQVTKLQNRIKELERELAKSKEKVHG